MVAGLVVPGVVGDMAVVRGVVVGLGGDNVRLEIGDLKISKWFPLPGGFCRPPWFPYYVQISGQDRKQSFRVLRYLNVGVIDRLFGKVVFLFEVLSFSGLPGLLGRDPDAFHDGLLCLVQSKLVVLPFKGASDYPGKHEEVQSCVGKNFGCKGGPAT